MIDIDNVFNIFIFEPGAADMMASGTLLALLQKRLEFFQLHDKVLPTPSHTFTHRHRDTPAHCVIPRSPLSVLCAKVSLFVLRFPLETLFDLKDLVNDSVMKMLLDEDLGLARPFLRFILRRVIRPPHSLLTSPHYIRPTDSSCPGLNLPCPPPPPPSVCCAQIVACRFAVVAVSKRPPTSVVETSVLSDPRIIGASLACGSVIQVDTERGT